jgi:2-polyprenyl-6-methoxyphenol hydroxylase-like FAD-dependent oxidoreductase
VSGARRALVVGGGIGGLAAALGLQRRGWDVRVLERRTAGAVAAQPGSGISVWPNGARALAALGVREQALAGAALAGRSGVRTPSGRWVARTDIGGAVRDRFGLPLLITTRERLAAGLAGALGAGRIEYGVTVDAVDAEAPAALAGALAREADLVVIADGARSRLRGAVLPASPEVVPAADRRARPEPRAVAGPGDRRRRARGPALSPRGRSGGAPGQARVTVARQARAPAGSIATSMTAGAISSMRQPSPKSASISSRRTRRGPKPGGWRSLKQSMRYRPPGGRTCRSPAS